ncbi:MAG: acetyl/propionyl/methylcrotonyl-CoA carboxylase subunit alpha [Chloroflexota bacterium]
MATFPFSRPIKRVLVANRGEIAVRVIRGCRDAGIESVALYSDPDIEWPHVRLADFAMPLAGSTAAETYLNFEKVLNAARASGADAIHPGYGFLSENPEFAQACRVAGITFIGPTPEAMRLLGSKTSARQVMQAAGVPVVPGALKALPTAELVAEAASDIGYPIALKAVSGGGGKGMRVVQRAEDVEAAFRTASSEAAAAFGDGSLYVERYLERPRHVEVQILADHHGNAVHLGERECSIQRRHQKVIEESPSPVVNEELRARLGQAAVNAALASGYHNAGTVEFLLDSHGEFFFLEVNARLQVEHPVTELVTGIDLVREQLRVAAGEPLGYGQEAIQHRGAALECRIYAEDALNRYMPSVGKVLEARLPHGPGVRVDGALESGLEISVYYDPLLAKLCTWGENRAQAIARMRRALQELVVLGPITNAPLHEWILSRPDFIAGDTDTGWLERVWPDERADAPEAMLGALALLIDEQRAAGSPPEPSPNEIERISSWARAGRVAGMRTR